MVLDDMCVLMSGTTLNSCKLAVYEGEVLQKSTTFLSFAPSGEDKKKIKNDDKATAQGRLLEGTSARPRTQIKSRFWKLFRGYCSSEYVKI